MTVPAGIAHELDPWRAALSEVAPLWRRVLRAEPASPTRLRSGSGRLTTLVRTVGVLAGRSISVPGVGRGAIDATYRAAEVLAWVENADPAATGPVRNDAAWRWSLPPDRAWTFAEQVPDTAIREVVRSGALTLKTLAEREGVPDATPRAQTTDSLLDAVVLTVHAPGGNLPVTLRALSALTRAGFLARGGSARIDTSGRWIRVAGAYGSVYVERAGGGLTMLA